MADQVGPPEFHGSLPASAIVEQFGNEIRAAITEVATKAPEIAVVAAQKRALRWYATTLLIAVIVSATVSWLVINYLPQAQHATQFILKGPGYVETCKRISGSDDVVRTFTCQVLPATPN